MTTPLRSPIELGASLAGLAEKDGPSHAARWLWLFGHLLPNFIFPTSNFA
jgi:hypothetical protein